MSEKKKWYPVYTNPRAEKKAYELLLKKGIESYLPLHKQLKQWSDRKKWVEEPLIKSYLFVHIETKDLAEVLMTSGVCRFLYFSGKVAAMPDRQIEDLKLLLASENELEISDYRFHKGQDVMIRAGALKGFRGELVDFQSHKKIILRMEHIGQSLIVQVPLAFIEPLRSSESQYLN